MWQSGTGTAAVRCPSYECKNYEDAAATDMWQKSKQASKQRSRVNAHYALYSAGAIIYTIGN
jgi:hypothetical protein